MTSLFVLAIVLFVIWVWALVQRDGTAAFMAEWSYVPLLGAVLATLMAVALWTR